MNRLERIKDKLSKLRSIAINISLHAKLKLGVEGILEKDVIENLRHPEALGAAVQDRKNKNKFILWFRQSNSISHKYVIEFQEPLNQVEVVTVVKLRIKWQKRLDKHAR